MDPELIEIEGGEVLANFDDRTVTGLLVPFNELGNTNAGRFMVQAGDLALPSDPSVISLNLDHERSQNVAVGKRVWEQAEGIMATYSVARTAEGDAYLADLARPAAERERPALSGEFHCAIKGGKAVPGSGRLWGGAAVRRGAFPSAMVLAEDRSSASKYVTEYTDEQGVTWRRVEETTTTVTETETGVESTSVTTVTEETTGEQEGTMDPETTTVQAGAVPVTLAGDAAPVTTLQRGPDLATIFASIATIKNRLTSRTDREAAETVLASLPDTHMILAALQDVVPGGATPLTAAGIVQHDWVGLIAQGVPYVREYISLHKPGTQISLAGKKGFKIKRGTAAAPVTGNFDGEYAGNKSEVKSYKGFTTPHESVLDQFAIAEDIARVFYDLPGGAEAVAAFLSLIVEDHLVWSDETAREYIVETAGAPIAPNTAAYATSYPEAVGMLLQGIITLKRKKADGRRDTPTYAIANDTAYEEIIYAAGGPENLPAFINLTMNTLGQGSADGVQVVAGDTGIADTPSVLVGADYAIDFDEPVGGPLLIDAIDIAKGGIDKAVHGYLQTFVKRPEAVVLIGEADV